MVLVGFTPWLLTAWCLFLFLGCSQSRGKGTSLLVRNISYRTTYVPPARAQRATLLYCGMTLGWRVIAGWLAQLSVPFPVLRAVVDVASSLTPSARRVFPPPVAVVVRRDFVCAVSGT